MQENRRIRPGFVVAAALGLLAATVPLPRQTPRSRRHRPGLHLGQRPRRAPLPLRRAGARAANLGRCRVARAAAAELLSDVAPLLARWCSDCHAGPDAEANLRLDRYEFLLVGGDSGPPVVIGNPAASLLVAKVERRDRPAMPPRKRLPRAAVTTLRAWIAAGAPP